MHLFDGVHAFSESTRYSGFDVPLHIMICCSKSLNILSDAEVCTARGGAECGCGAAASARAVRPFHLKKGAP